MNEATTSAPYIGLSPYKATDRDRFFGRDDDIHILISRIFSKRVTLFFGVTGAGKSSLLQAGVIPELSAPTRHNLDVAYHTRWSPWEDPRLSLKASIKRSLFDLGKLSSSNPPGWADLSLQDFLRRHTAFATNPFIIIIDQFEEFFSFHAYSSYFEPFIQELFHVMNDTELSVAFVLSLREDFLAELLDLFENHVSSFAGNRYRLKKLSKAQAREAIEKPVSSFDFQYEEALIAQLLQDLSGEEQDLLGDTEYLFTHHTGELFVEAPYLQLVCQKLWEEAQKNPSQKILTLQQYHDLGGIENIILEHIKQVMVRRSLREQVLAYEMFQHLVTRRGTKMAYRDDDLADTLGVSVLQIEPLLGYLSSNEVRILRSEQRSESSSESHSTWYELYHDVFARILRPWAEEFVRDEDHQRYRQIFVATQKWLHENEDQSFLLRGNRLSLVENWARVHWETLSANEQSFIDSSAQHERSDTQALISTHAARWLCEEKDSMLLLQGWRLNQVKEWAADRKNLRLLSAEEREFLHAGIRQQHAEVKKEQDTLFLKKLAVGAIVFLALLAGFYAVLALKAQKEAQERLVGSLLSNGLNVRDTDNLLSASHHFMLAAQLTDDENISHNARLAGDFLSRGIELDAILEHDATILGAEFSRDGSRLLSWSDNGTVRIWETESPTNHIDLEHEETIVKALFSPDSNLVLSWGGSGTVYVWETESGAQLFSFSHEDGVVAGAVFSPDGQRILTWGGNLAAYVWEMESGTQLSNFLFTGSIAEVTFTQDATRILTWSNEGQVQLWDTEAGELLWSLEVGHRNYQIYGAQLSPDGRQVLTWGADKYVRIWDAESAQILSSLPHSEQLKIEKAVFSQNGRRVVTWSSDSMIRVWKNEMEEKGKLLFTLPHQGEISDLMLDGDAGRILTWNAEQKLIRIWEKNGDSRALSLSSSALVSELVFSRDTTRILTLGTERTARLWSIARAVLYESSEEKSPIPKDVSGTSFSRNAERISIWSAEKNTVQVWDRERGKIVFTSDPASGEIVWGADLSRDGKRILTWGEDKSVHIREVDSGDSISSLVHKDDDDIYGAVFSEDAARVLTWVGAGRVKVWNSADGSRLASLPYNNAVFEATFSHNAERILSWSSSGSIWNWDWEKELFPSSIIAHEKDILGAAFSPNGEYILSWGSDRAVRLRDSARGTLLVSLLHPAAVQDVSFSRDGQHILTWSEDKKVRIWETESGVLLVSASGHGAGRILHADFSEDARHVVIVSDDGSIHRWTLPTAEDCPNEELVLRLEAQTGTRLNKRGKIEFLSSHDWQQRKEVYNRRVANK